MTLDRWKEQGVISPEQHALLTAVSRREPCSVFLELNIVLYAGVLAFAGGLAWTVQTYSQQLGDVLILTVLSGLIAACLWYCVTRALPWSRAETPSPNLIFDYVLYLGALAWSVELTFIENRFHLFSGKWDTYLLATACFFFALAYRFDNRFVLSLALSSLAGWFGLKISHWPGANDATYRQYAILYSLVIATAGLAFERFAIKPRFLAVYLNLAANVVFVAVLSGVFQNESYLRWFFLLLALAGASLAYGLNRGQFSFVAYSVVYGYVGLSSVLMRDVHDMTAQWLYFVFTGMAVLAGLAVIAARFRRDS